jgi:hypothetical protein
MNISELFEEIQNEFIIEELNGEFLLQGRTIVWSYNLEDSSEEIDFIEEDEDNMFGFDSVSSEELLLEGYQEDFEKLQNKLDEINETDNWKFSNTDINESIISFVIF